MKSQLVLPFLVYLVMFKDDQLFRLVRFRSSVEPNTNVNVDNGKLFASPRSSITTAEANGATVPRAVYLTTFSFGRVPAAAEISDPIS